MLRGLGWFLLSVCSAHVQALLKHCCNNRLKGLLTLLQSRGASLRQTTKMFHKGLFLFTCLWSLRAAGCFRKVNLRTSGEMLFCHERLVNSAIRCQLVTLCVKASKSQWHGSDCCCPPIGRNHSNLLSALLLPDWPSRAANSVWLWCVGQSWAELSWTLGVGHIKS